ncbi:glycosyltransferase family protein, partial [Desulfovulcanus sp.]
RHPEVQKFKPDIIIQQETLGPRTLLLGLEHFPCPKIFWSIDTHLNAFWHKLYGRNFDLVLTTQKGWVDKLQAGGLEKVNWLPWFGIKKEWKDFSRRKYDLSFVGRITAHRPARKWMVDFLRQEFGGFIAQDVEFARMLDIYEQTKLAPNEAIAGEVNFRTFEAASCGALVLNQDLGDEISSLFIPGKETLIFNHVLELRELIKFYLKHQSQAEKIALASWKKIQNEHLAVHRARKLLRYAQEITPRLCARGQAFKNIVLSLFQLWQNQASTLNKKEIIDLFLKLPIDPEVLSALIELHADRKDKTESFLIPVLQQKQYDFHLGLNLTCSFAAQKHNNFPLARQFWYRYLLSKGQKLKPVSTPLQLSLFWAKELARKGEIFRIGLRFDPRNMLPQSALECLVYAERLDPENKEVLNAILTLIQNQKGLEPLLLQIQSHLSLVDPENWRLGLDLALTNLKAFRLGQGLEELFLAFETAQKKNKTDLFFSRLKKKDTTLKNYFIRLLRERG